ncbi:MAG: IS91 family transposase [Sideroxydans sp.]|nr:IS91 family transposase [Sideroxydans sp.]
MAGVLDTCGPAYLAEHRLIPGQAKVWRAISACRTAALGGQVESCNVCGTTRYVYHSCRNRHCPQCQTRAKEAWLAARRRELLPVPYFHLVFTLPHDLNGLIGQRPRLLYERLFAAVAATLSEFAANPRWLGGTPAFTLVLHTWQQDLGRHVHVHALVAGGALTATGKWATAKRGFLFPVQALSKVFRGKFVAALERERSEGALRDEALCTRSDWQQLRRALHAHDWVVYAKQPLGGPAQVLEYLGRYTHRVAISNERIVRVDERGVAFRVRANDGGKKRLRLLSGTEFIRRFLRHVLPRGFKRIRHYGLLGPAHKTAHLAAARKALAAPAPAPEPAVLESVAAFMQRVTRIEWERCPHCQRGRFEVVQAISPAPRRQPRGPP